MVDMASRSVPLFRLKPDGVDPILITCVICLLCASIVLVSSASVEIAARTFGNPLYLTWKHLAFMAIAVIAGAITLMVPLRFWLQAGPVWLVISALLLGAVLIPGLGREVNGSVRWIPLGPFSLQGSEFVKLLTIIYMAGFLARHNDTVTSHIRHLLMPLLFVGGLIVLLLEQPDYGTAVVIMASLSGLIFLSGVPMRQFVPLVTLCLAAIVTLALIQPYRLTRVISFADPWEHAFGAGYQLTQALIAFGRGEWFGLGLGNSIQKLFYLPEAHTDFLFSIAAEELGAVGAIGLIALFTVFVLRGLWTGYRAQQDGEVFAALLAYGMVLLIGIQALINIGVNVGVLPTKGLTLPLLSFGGNSFVATAMMVAVLLRVEHETRLRHDS